MLLDPVALNDPPELGDDEASAPKKLAKGDELKSKLERQLDKLGDLQNVVLCGRPAFTPDCASGT